MTKKIETREQFREELLTQAESRKISKGELAARAGMDRCTLYRDSNLTLTNALALCREAGLTIVVTDTPAILLRAAANLEI